MNISTPQLEALTMAAIIRDQCLISSFYGIHLQSLVHCKNTWRDAHIYMHTHAYRSPSAHYMNATMYREAAARRRVYFNLTRIYAYERRPTKNLGAAWEVGTMPNTGKCILGNHLSLVVHNGVAGTVDREIFAVKFFASCLGGEN